MYGKVARNGLSFLSTPSASPLFGKMLKAGVSGVPPASARS